MYIQDRLFFLLFIFSSMLTVSFFLSSITILANQAASIDQMGYLPSIKEQDKTRQVIESVPEASNQPTVEKEGNGPAGAKASNQLEVLPLAMNNQTEEDLRTSDEVKVNEQANRSSNNASRDNPDESDSEGDNLEVVTEKSDDSSESGETIQTESDQPDQGDEGDQTLIETVISDDEDPNPLESNPDEGDEGGEGDEGDQTLIETVISDHEDPNPLESNPDEEPDNNKLYLQSSSSGSPCLDASQNSDSEQLDNSICIELYRDDGDMVPDTNNDSLLGFTLIINQPIINRDYYEFISLSPGYYFAKFYQLGEEVSLLRQVAGDASAFNSLDGQIEPTAEHDSATKPSANENEHTPSWETILLEATPVEVGYCVRFEPNSESELLGDLNGITLFQSSNSNVESNGD